MDFNKTFESIILWIKELWNKLNIKEWSENIGGSSAQAVHAAIMFGIFFAVGFLLSKYLKIIVFSIIFSVIWILILKYNGVLIFDKQAFNLMLGFEPQADFGFIVDSILAWIKTNLVIFISSIIGFLVGCKLG